MLKVLTHLGNESTVFDLNAGGLLSGSDDHGKTIASSNGAPYFLAQYNDG